jgi:hypothetical protein
MCISYIISVIAITILLYIFFVNYKYYYENNNQNNQNNKENFYPLLGWGNGRWGWQRNYLQDTGNWRPYNYYPAYSGYWKECPSGSWCPPYVSCKDPVCQ